MSRPAEGGKAPRFKSKDETGHEWTLEELEGKPVVLYFYAKDDTAGCTTEACKFRDAQKALAKSGAVVLGVSRDDAASHQKFKSKYDLNFPLLVDTDGKISDAYGTWVQKNMYGRTYMGMQRSTFLISPDGTLAKVWPKVKPDEHADEVVAALDELKARGTKKS